MKSKTRPKKVVVVGDKFNAFSNGRSVLTLSQMENMIQTQGSVSDKSTQYVAGQGIREDYNGIAMKHLHQKHTNEYHNEAFESCTLTTLERNVHAHKNVKHNILIGKALRVNESEFELPLLIDERCELMGDHQTGKHVQGMILVEACRQTFIAITEEFYASEKFGESYYVINDMNMNFSNFLFPMPAFIHYEILEQNMNDHRSRFSARVRVYQHTTLCASMTISFTVYAASVINEKESTLADSLTQTMLLFQGSASQVDAGITHA